MNIIELLDEVGHTNLRFQYLHECVKGARLVGRGRDQHTEVRFGTAEIKPSTLLDNKRIGVVVWFDREHWDRVQQEKAK